LSSVVSDLTAQLRRQEDELAALRTEQARWSAAVTNQDRAAVRLRERCGTLHLTRLVGPIDLRDSWVSLSLGGGAGRGGHHSAVQAERLTADNRRLLAQLSELQDRFVQVSNEKMEATDALGTERVRAARLQAAMDDDLRPRLARAQDDTAAQARRLAELEAALHTHHQRAAELERALQARAAEPAAVLPTPAPPTPVTPTAATVPMPAAAEPPAVATVPVLVLAQVKARLASAQADLSQALDERVWLTEQLEEERRTVEKCEATPNSLHTQTHTHTTSTPRAC
jgi:hypothetical protein